MYFPKKKIIFISGLRKLYLIMNYDTRPKKKKKLVNHSLFHISYILVNSRDDCMSFFIVYIILNIF